MSHPPDYITQGNVMADSVGYAMSTCPFWAAPFASFASGKKVIKDEHGAIIRGDTSRKILSLVFTGDEFAEGGELIRKTLRQHQVPASFFLTGNFYRNPAFHSLIMALKEDGHYLGAHSDQHLLYADWEKRDSTLVTQEQFVLDLQYNYERMETFGIQKKEAVYFLPPYEWYNADIVRWTEEAGLQLVNFTPGTRSTADYTYPEMGKRYVSSEEIYQSVINGEANDPHGLNGFILLLHIGTDPRRKDKFYHRLDRLLHALKGKGYQFVSINTLLH